MLSEIIVRIGQIEEELTKTAVWLNLFLMNIFFALKRVLTFYYNLLSLQLEMYHAAAIKSLSALIYSAVIFSFGPLRSWNLFWELRNLIRLDSF